MKDACGLYLGKMGCRYELKRNVSQIWFFSRRLKFNVPSILEISVDTFDIMDVDVSLFSVL